MGTLAAIISSMSSLAINLLLGTSSSSSSNDGDAIEKELNKLMNTLERIQATLRDAEEREIKDRSVKLWLKELKQVACAAEDVLDEYHYEFLQAQVELRADLAESSCKRTTLELPDDLTDRIKQTISRFDEIAKDRMALQLHKEDGIRCVNNETQISPTSHIVVESNIFGREDEKEELIDLICGDSKHANVIEVVSIIGMGGLGKTTLAQFVYNDHRIRQNFDQLGWLCVSDDFNVKRLTQEVVESITGVSCDIKNLGVLQTKLQEKIVGKKIFIVLDDVWNEKRSDWELFQTPFLSAKSVKVLVTTRNEPVAQIMQTFPSFYLGNLSEEQCWQLFQLYAFGGANCNEDWKLKIGKQIMKNCGRLPLAVKLIASLLRHEANEESWREILECELWELEATKEIYPPLQISYLRLPTYLKPCLIYCSMFPKGYTYYVEELTKLWYAQGYIELKGRKTIEEIGREYVEQLFGRSFFGGKDLFNLHDMIHDLARSNSENECYSIECGKAPPIFPKQIFHLYVDDFDELVELFPSSSFTPLRTLIVSHKVKNFAIISDISETPVLRNLVFNSQCYGFGFLNSIGSLKHIRNISLNCFTFEKLPTSICTLYNLQTLTLNGCHNLIELPNNIGNLVSLQFLSLSYCLVSRLPESICNLKNMKSLSISYGELVELPEHIGNLVRLEKLLVNGCNITVLPASLCQIESLRTLELTSSMNIEELPHEIGNLTNLQTLFVSQVSSLPTSLNKLTGIEDLDLEIDVTMSKNHYGFGWLNDIVDLKGTLFITGLQNITSLAGSKYLNLINTHKLEYLMLSWSARVYIHFYAVNSSRIIINIKNDGNDEYCGDEMDSLLLERLQHHPNLKKLEIIDYRGIAFPKWAEDPFACSSLKEVYLDRCENLVTLPFSNLKSLKCLTINKCHSLQLVQSEFVPSQLRKLIIWNCEGLIFMPGVQNLKSLIKLEIHDCPNLESLLKKPETSCELNMHDSFYRMLLMGLSNLTLLQILEIVNCPKLGVVADELCPIKSCVVEVGVCPNLREWCLQHNFGYFEGLW